MTKVNVHQAEAQLERLIQRARAGEDIVILVNGEPAVRLTPIAAPAAPPPPDETLLTPRQDALDDGFEDRL